MRLFLKVFEKVLKHCPGETGRQKQNAKFTLDELFTMFKKG